jgi:hypothetical protein
MKQLLVILTVFLGLTPAYAQDSGRSLTAPSPTLEDNDCVFKNKGIAALMDYGFIVDKCDRRYSSLMVLFADHLPEGACVFKVIQKMTGHTIARIVEKCPALERQVIEGIIPDAPLEEVLPEKQAAKPKAKPQAQQQAVAAPAAPKNKEPVKPKTNEQVEKGKEGYYINPNEIEF